MPREGGRPRFGGFLDRLDKTESSVGLIRNT